MTVPEWFAVAALGVIMAIVGWGFKRMIATQDSMAANMATMTLDITRLCGKIEMAAIVQINDSRRCDTRHRENTARLSELKNELDKLAHVR